MKYPSIKKSGLSHAQLANIFGFKTVYSFRSSTAHHRYMEAIDNLLSIQDGLTRKEITKLITESSSKLIENLKT